MILLLKKDGEMIRAFYYGISKMKLVWKDEIEQMSNDNRIQKIYEIIDDDYQEVWYYIKDIKENAYAVKYKAGRELSSSIMKKYLKKYNFFRVGTQIINLIDNGVFPIVVKVKPDKFLEYYDKLSNRNYFFFNNYYCEENNVYRTVRAYRNKVSYKEFTNEIEAIKWCRDIKCNVSKITDSKLIDSIYYDIN